MGLTQLRQLSACEHLHTEKARRDKERGCCHSLSGSNLSSYAKISILGSGPYSYYQSRAARKALVSSWAPWSASSMFGSPSTMMGSIHLVQI